MKFSFQKKKAPGAIKNNFLPEVNPSTTYLLNNLLSLSLSLSTLFLSQSLS
ncbi:hypothetical protein HanRHA438_Chr07g0297491 [Helianthus annuus]|nr:hypothetical protein HanIR_Chr07g0309521 [Helianthus annuus]KAJ0907318.1 hypothetical protein HanRHA438_Chr07g0297491 [Helianthus annuus]